MHRRLNDQGLDQYRHWVASTPGAGTGSIPGDLRLVLDHGAAQSAMLHRAQQGEHNVMDTITQLLDYIEQGGDAAWCERVMRQAPAVQQAYAIPD